MPHTITAFRAVDPSEISQADAIAYAQAELDFHPDNSPYWDSPGGQEVLVTAKQFKLVARTTNRERCAAYARVRAAAR